MTAGSRAPRLRRTDHGGLRLLGLAIALVVVLAACVRGPTSVGGSSDPDALRVVATTTVLADLVRQVGGDRVSVVSLVPKGGEVHTFDPSPSDALAIADADLIVMNGLGLDDWLGGLVTDAGADAPILRLAEDVPGLVPITGEGSAGTVNPHLWLDVAYARAYATRIRDELVQLDPSHAATIEKQATAFDERLAALDASIRQRFAAVPSSARRIISFHDAFPYYARAYGLDIIGTVVHAPGQDPSAGEIGALVSAIRTTGASAILSEAQFSQSLVDTIAAETGVTVVSDLYDDTLGDPPVDSFVGMLEWDTDRILEALHAPVASG